MIKSFEDGSHRRKGREKGKILDIGEQSSLHTNKNGLSVVVVVFTNLESVSSSDSYTCGRTLLKKEKRFQKRGRTGIELIGKQYLKRGGEQERSRTHRKTIP